MVAEQIIEVRKEKEKKEKKKKEKKKSILKMQDHTTKAAYIYTAPETTKNMKLKESPKTAPNFVIHSRNFENFNTFTHKSQTKNEKEMAFNKFSVEFQKYMEGENNGINFGNDKKNVKDEIIDQSIRKISTGSQENLGEGEKFTNLANNVIFK